MSIDWSKDVAEFHKHINYMSYPVPDQLSASDFEQRFSYLEEELEEYLQAYGADYLEDQVDSLIDLIYFAIGSLIRMGIDPRPAWNEVHKANMRKVPKKGEHKHSIKPEGWTAPDARQMVIPWHD